MHNRMMLLTPNLIISQYLQKHVKSHIAEMPCEDGLCKKYMTVGLKLLLSRVYLHRSGQIRLGK